MYSSAFFFSSTCQAFSNSNTVPILAAQNIHIDPSNSLFPPKSSHLLLFWPWHSPGPSLSQSSLLVGVNRREEPNRWTWPFCLTAVVFLVAALLNTTWGLAQQTLVASFPSLKILQEQRPKGPQCLKLGGKSKLLLDVLRPQYFATQYTRHF